MTEASIRACRGIELVRTVIATGLALVACAAGASGQDRMITLSATAIRPGTAVRITSTTCTGDLTLLVDGKRFPATLTGTTFELATASLAPGTHSVATDCAGSASQTETLTVLADVQPRVVCARNVSPRDGTATARTADAATTEAKRIGDAKKAAEAKKQAWPTPDETSLLLERCDKDWLWTLRLEDRLVLDVVGYSEWLRDEKNAQKPVHLFIDGVELGHIGVNHVGRDPVTNIDRVEAVLSFEDDEPTAEGRTANRKALAQVLRTARAKKWDFAVNDMPVSIGQAGGPQWPTTAYVRINPYPPGMANAALVAALVLALALLYAAWNTPLLRDGDRTSPFSLARNQMALWFFVIFSAFLFVTVSTGQAAAMSTTALTLIGLSGGTALAAVFIEHRKSAISDTERSALEAEKARLVDELDGKDGLRTKRNVQDIDAAEAARLDKIISERLDRLEVVKKSLQAEPSPAPAPSRGWLTDVLSDEHGISFHRLQMVAWTIAMVGVFVVAVWRTFAMPDFDATMLGLLGISSGTYLGFKFPERG